MQETVSGLQSLKFLLSSLLQKMFAGPWSKFKEYFLVLVPDIRNLCNDTCNFISDYETILQIEEYAYGKRKLPESYFES